MSDAKPVKTVGYIGMGIMGKAMAGNLVKAGFEVTVWNRSPGKCAGFKKVATSPAEMAKAGPDAIFINVTDTPDVEKVLFGDTGVAAGARRGLVVIDNSTISPDATRQFAQRLDQQGVTLLDAPVSGGDVGARNATLSIMVGGPPEVFERCLPLFQAMGRNITHLGPVGSGQVCKACNQVAVACNMLAACEALALAKKCGLDLEKMIQVVGAGAGGSWQLTNLGPKIAKGDYAPGFMIDLVLKDLAIVLGAAEQHHLPLAAVKIAQGYFQQVRDAGGGRLGTQAMAKALEQRASFRYAG